MTRLPLRAVPEHQLQAAWSAGHTFYQYEGKPPRAWEKPVEEMTLEELIATQRSEPLSESRRSFLTTRQGVLSLDAPASPSGVVELMEFVADPGPAGLIDYIDQGFATDELDDLEIAEHDALRYGVPVITQDFVTGRQIEWEREQSRHGPTYTLQLAPTEAGSLTVNNVGRGILPGHDFRKIAASAVGAFFRSVGRASTIDELHARVDLVREALDDPAAFLYRDPDLFTERAHAQRMDDELAHSSYEAFDEDGNLLIHHRSKVRTPWETWHHTIERVNASATELGFDLCSDAEIESLLGCEAWDDAGNALASNEDEAA